MGEKISPERLSEMLNRHIEADEKERWTLITKELTETGLKTNSVLLTIGYGILFAALNWMHGKIPDRSFFLAAVCLIISISLFFGWVIWQIFINTRTTKKISSLLKEKEVKSYEELCEKYEEFSSRSLSLSFKIWNWIFFPTLCLALFSGCIILKSSFNIAFNGIPDDKVTNLQHENAALETQLSQAVLQLQHERLFHFNSKIPPYLRRVND